MSRTYRKCTGSWFRNVHNRNRILSVKNLDEANSRVGYLYEDLDSGHIHKLGIRSSAIPPDPWEDIHISGAGEIRMPGKGNAINTGRNARRFMRNHKCSFRAFADVFYGSSGRFDSSVSLREDLIFKIKSD